MSEASRTMQRSLLVISLCLVTGLVNAEQIDGEELRDPTRPPSASLELTSLAPIATRNYAVDFIRAGGDAPIAVVNGQRVGVGELVDGSLVMAITREHVTLLIGNNEVNVRLNEVRVATPVDARQ